MVRNSNKLFESNPSIVSRETKEQIVSLIFSLKSYSLNMVTHFSIDFDKVFFKIDIKIVHRINLVNLSGKNHPETAIFNQFRKMNILKGYVI